MFKKIINLLKINECNLELVNQFHFQTSLYRFKILKISFFIFSIHITIFSTDFEKSHQKSDFR